MSNSLARQEIEELPLTEVRQLLTFRRNLPEIKRLYIERDEHLVKAKQLEEQIRFRLSEDYKEPRSKAQGDSVRKMCIKVLKSYKKGLTPVQIKDKIISLYPNHRIKNIYNATIGILSSSSDFKRLKSGKFVLQR